MTETLPSETQDGARCPKCAAPRGLNVQACARCGLVFALWNPATAELGKALDADAESLWQAVLASWEDEPRHLAFLKHCSAMAMLGAAGRRYRDRLVANPNDAMALAMQKKILGMATALLGSPSTRPQASFLTSRWFMLIIFLCALGGMVGGFFIYRR